MNRKYISVVAMCGVTLVLMATASLPVFGQVDRTQPGALERMRPGVVRIRAGVEDGIFLTWQTGTGFVVRSDPDGHYIVTVTHVVKGADLIDVEYFHDRNVPRPAKIVHMQGADENGLVLLFVKGRPPANTEILYPDARARLPGAGVTAIGFPRRGQAWQATTGKISAVQNTKISFTAQVNSGNSGGPLMNEAGRVVGVVTSTRDGIGFAASSSLLADVLEGWDFELPMRPSEPVESILFPTRGVANFSLSRPTALLRDGAGYLLFGHVAEGKTPDGMPYWRSVVWRLDSKLRVKRKTYFRDRTPGTSEVLEAVRMPDGRIAVRERVARDVASTIRAQKYDTRVAVLESSGKPPGREVYKNEYVKFDQRIFRTATPDLLGVSDQGRETYFFETTTGNQRSKTMQACSLYAPSRSETERLFCLGQGDESIQDVRVLEKRDLAGRRLAERILPNYYPSMISGHPDGGVLVALRWPYGSAKEGRLLKFDANLKLVWRYCYNMRKSTWAEIVRFWVLRNGDVLSYTRDTVPGYGNFYSLVYIDGTGRERWRKQIKQPRQPNDRPRFYDLLELKDGSMLITGDWSVQFAERSAGPGFVLRLGPDGKFLPVEASPR